MKPFYELRKPIWITHPTQVDFPLHMHDAVEIVYLMSGQTTVLCDAGRVELKPGDLYISFPNQVHGYENTRDFEGYVLIVTTPNLPGCKEILEQEQPRWPVVHPEGEDARTLVTLFKLMRADRDKARPFLLQGYAMTLFGKVTQLVELVPRSAGNSALQVVLQYIGTHYREPLTRGDIARAAGYSESHISHLFNEELKISLMEYITMLRMDDARKLLRQTSQPVGQIAISLGFSSVRSFNRYFAMQMNMTPSQYRAAGMTR